MNPKHRSWYFVPAAALWASAMTGAWASADPLAGLVAETLANNPEIRAARNERQAALARVSPAGALEDPMLEAGIVNLPASSRSLSQEDMTMKMIGLSQRFPWPGKRDLRRDASAREADAVEQGYRETVNRVLRELKLASYDALLAAESERLAGASRETLERLLRTAEARYAVGQGAQADVLKAQTLLTKMRDELLRLGRERIVAQAELGRLLARPVERAFAPGALTPPPGVALDPGKLREEAFGQRPQLLALRALIAKSEHSLALARKDGLPDFDVKFSYGQRDAAPSGMKREDMLSFTVAINLPIWRGSKVEPRIAEAHAGRDQALAMLAAQQNEVSMRLQQQVAAAEQNLASLRLYERELLPQARLTVEAASSAYRVGRVDFMTLLDSQMSVLGFETGRATALAGAHKALVEIDFLTGRLALLALDGQAPTGRLTGAEK